MNCKLYPPLPTYHLYSGTAKRRHLVDALFERARVEVYHMNRLVLEGIIIGVNQVDNDGNEYEITVVRNGREHTAFLRTV